jgi:hypothetical protein
MQERTRYGLSSPWCFRASAGRRTVGIGKISSSAGRHFVRHRSVKDGKMPRRSGMSVAVRMFLGLL